MTQEIILGLVRHLLTIGAGILVTRGKLSPDDAQTVVGGLMGLFGVAWSIKVKM